MMYPFKNKGKQVAFSYVLAIASLFSLTIIFYKRLDIWWIPSITFFIGLLYLVEGTMEISQDEKM